VKLNPPTIQTLPVTHLIGHHLTLSLANNRTAELWRSFMPRRREVVNAVGNELYSMQLYSEDHFVNFNPSTEFEKWAAVPVTGFDAVPYGMETFTIPEGTYAVFHYKGAPENGAEVFGYIFQQWLPQSGYELDNRPHFEVLGEKYKNGSPGSEEEIWIPVR
jgi:AraC family transcriptional regulator